ncbi:MAG TPA: M28 family peptidase [Polyangiaceae bacterium]|nr:M28 family peptidase [Polyangiaceae bacterium]
MHTVARGLRFVVGAHYDSVVDSPGADDNASGVASMLEVARACRLAPPSVALEFVAYARFSAIRTTIGRATGRTRSTTRSWRGRRRP